MAQLVKKDEAEDEAEEDERRHDPCQPSTLSEHEAGDGEEEQQGRVDPDRDPQDTKDFKRTEHDGNLGIGHASRALSLCM